MDGSDEYTNTTFDDSDKDKTYEPPPDVFRPEFVPQMQRGGNTSESEHGDAILSGTSFRCNNREKPKKSQSMVFRRHYKHLKLKEIE